MTTARGNSRRRFHEHHQPSPRSTCHRRDCCDHRLCRRSCAARVGDTKSVEHPDVHLAVQRRRLDRRGPKGRLRRGRNGRRQLFRDRRRRRPLLELHVRSEGRGESARPGRVHRRVRRVRRVRRGRSSRGRGRSGARQRRRAARRLAVGHGADQRLRRPRHHRRQPRRASSATSTPASTSPTPTSRRTTTPTNSADCSSGAPTPLLPGNDAQRPRHAHRRHDRRRGQRHRHHRRRAEREHRRHQVEQRRRLLLPGDGDLRVHVGRRARHRRHEQQLLRRPVAVQLRNDAEQRAIWKAERRAIRHAQSTGHRGRRRPRATTAPTCRTRASTSISPDFTTPGASRRARSPTPARVDAGRGARASSA